MLVRALESRLRWARLLRLCLVQFGWGFSRCSPRRQTDHSHCGYVRLMFLLRDSRQKMACEVNWLRYFAMARLSLVQDLLEEHRRRSRGNQEHHLRRHLRPHERNALQAEVPAASDLIYEPAKVVME